MLTTDRVRKAPIKVATNLSRIGEVSYNEAEFEFNVVRAGGLLSAVRLFMATFRHDYILLNGQLRTGFILAFLKTLLPSHRARIILLDVLLPTPTGIRGRAKAWLVGRLLRRIHRIMLYYRNTDGWQHHYGIPAEKFGYIPFKLNSPDLIRASTPTDQGYVFCGGKTRRDFTTLFEAVRGLDIPVRVVTTSDRDIAPHGTVLDEDSAPDNVEIIRLDGSAEPFVQQMAGSRLVVQPIVPDISGAGMSVYIMAMALRKCVITTTGPGAEDVLTGGEAIIVPAADPVALRSVIERAYSDPTYRAPFEESGHRYAIGCGEEQHLYHTILSRIHADRAPRTGFLSK
jgi:hypothetical protein